MKATELITALVEHVSRHGDRDVEAFCDRCDSAYHGVDTVSIVHVRIDEDSYYTQALINLTED